MRHEASNSVCSYVSDTIKLLLSQVLFYFFLENEEKPVLNHEFESDCHPNCHPIPHFWCQYGCRRRLPPKLPPDTVLLVPIRVPKAIATQIATRYRTSGANMGAEGNCRHFEVRFKCGTQNINYFDLYLQGIGSGKKNSKLKSSKLRN